MDWTPALKDFIAAHLNDPTDRLLLSAGRYPDVDVPAAVAQIEARRQLRQKLPEWYAQPDLIMGGRVPAEQCSSELTARYKAQLVRGEVLADLTGGMGVDLYYMSRHVRSAFYVERQPALCDAARHNFAVLGADNVSVMNADGLEALASLPQVDTLYLDPARRSADGGRVYDLADCEPDVVCHRSLLLAHCRRLVVKISPMADLSRVLQSMPGTVEVHILAVRGECKEVLLLLDADAPAATAAPGAADAADVQVVCTDFRAADVLTYAFRRGDELQAHSRFATAVGSYLYEPDVTLLKAGAFRSLGQRFGVEKLDVNSHLYTSATPVPDFPGRIFAVDEVIPFASRTLKKLRSLLPQANITTRNFPLTADQLRARTGVRDGGEVYLFGTMLQGVGPLLLRCRKWLAVACLLVALSCLCPQAAPLRAQTLQDPALEALLAPAAQEPLLRWTSGRPFMHLAADVGLLLEAEQPALRPEASYERTWWTYDKLVAEENWLGQTVLYIRFLAPDGRAYRFDTGRGLEAAADTTFVPHLPGLCDGLLAARVDSLLRSRTLWLLVDDARLTPADSASAELPARKFQPAHIDSVVVGTEEAPLRVCFTTADGRRLRVDTALPASPEARTTTPVHRVFAVDDPRLRYPDIPDDVWEAICTRRVLVGMSMAEVRLSLGRYESFERVVTRAGLVEVWRFRTGRVVRFLDGKVQ